MTFNIKQIEEDMLKKNGGKLSEKNKRQLHALRQMDESGDGETSLMELIHVEEEKEEAEKSASRNKKIALRYVFPPYVLPRLCNGYGYSSTEVTKESRVEGGSSISSSAKASNIDTPPSSSRRRLGRVWSKHLIRQSKGDLLEIQLPMPTSKSKLLVTVVSKL